MRNGKENTQVGLMKHLNMLVVFVELWWWFFFASQSIDFMLADLIHLQEAEYLIF